MQERLPVFTISECLCATGTRDAESSCCVACDQAIVQRSAFEIGMQEARVEAVSRSHRIDNVYFQGRDLDSLVSPHGHRTVGSCLHDHYWDDFGQLEQGGVWIAVGGNPTRFSLIRQEYID